MDFDVRHLPAGAPAVLRETLQAESAELLRSRLDAGGSVVLELRPLQTRWQLWRLRNPRLDVAWWCRELETLLRAGMTVVEALETLSGGRRDASRDPVHAALLRALRQGQSLSDAMRQTGTFPPVLVAGVTASERTSTLPEALRDYLRYDELIQRLQRQALSAALYPAIVVSLGAAISAFLLLYVIPRFSRMYGEGAQGLSTATEVVLGLSRGLRDHSGVLVVLIGLAVLAALLAWQSGRWRLVWARARDGLPGLRGAARQFNRAKLFHSLAMLMRGGYNLDEALRVCERRDLGAYTRAALDPATSHISP
jgi:general secretion pathway protein F